MCVISRISVVSLNYLVLVFLFVYLSYVFSYTLNSLKVGHFRPAIEPRRVDLLFADLIHVWYLPYIPKSSVIEISSQNCVLGGHSLSM